MGAHNFIAFGKAKTAREADGWGEKWESRVIDCGATNGGQMWAFYGWASC